MKTTVALCVLAGLAAGAHAQGTGAWKLTSAVTADGDSIIEETLGETNATFAFSVDLTPDPGQTLGNGSTVIGFGSVIANFLGDDNWQKGSVTWTMNPDLIFLTGDLTEKGGAGFGPEDLHDMNAGQIPGFGPFSSADPISVITIDWNARGDYSKRNVSFKADTQDADTIQAYIKKSGATFEEPQTWSMPDMSVTFSVEPIVPAPGALALLGLGAIACGRRRS